MRFRDKRTKETNSSALKSFGWRQTKRFCANGKKKQRGTNIFNVELVGPFGGGGSLFITSKELISFLHVAKISFNFFLTKN